MAVKDKDIVASAVVSKKEKIGNAVVFVLLCLGAVVIVFRLFIWL